MQERLIVTIALLLNACGPSVGEGSDAGPEDDSSEMDEFRKSIAGYYSSRLSEGQVVLNHPNAQVEVFRLGEDGTGEYYRHRCDGSQTDPVPFSWSIEESEPRVVTMVSESGTTRTWEVPDPCTTLWGSTLEWPEYDLRTSVYPGQACDPQLGALTPEGRRPCDFETCGGVSKLCGGEE